MDFVILSSIAALAIIGAYVLIFGKRMTHRSRSMMCTISNYIIIIILLYMACIYIGAYACEDIIRACMHACMYMLTAVCI